MPANELRLATLTRARDLAGGVSALGESIGLSATVLDAMLHEQLPIPTWLFMQLATYVNEQEIMEQPSDPPLED